MKKKSATKAYSPYKPAKKKATKRKSAIQRSQDTLIKGRLKFLEETHKTKMQAKEDEQCSDPIKTSTQETAGKPSETTNLGSLKLKPKATENIVPHLQVRALAGTGKTTTLVEGMKVIKGLASSITPSSQQAAVWGALKEGKNGTIRFNAFGKAIADELSRRLQGFGLDKLGCEASTFHSMGYKAVNANIGYCKPNKYAVLEMICNSLGQDFRELKRDAKLLTMVNAVDKLVGLCKQNLSASDPDSLDVLTSHYDVDLGDSKSSVYSMVPEILEKCKDPKGNITFDDMVWLPVALNLPIAKSDTLLVDECFPAGTLVETSEGLVPIEDIADNPLKDWQVLSSVDGGKTSRYSSVTSAYATPRSGPLVRIQHENGEIICTANHPLWTNENGWTAAGMVTKGLSLCYLWETNERGGQNVLSELCNNLETEGSCFKASEVEESETLLNLRESHHIGVKQAVLTDLCGKVETGQQRPLSRSQQKGEDFQTHEGCENRDSESYGEIRNSGQSFSDNEREGTQTLDPRRKRQGSNKTATPSVSRVGETPPSLALDPRICVVKWRKETESISRTTNSLQDRHCIIKKEDCSGGGWRITQQSNTPISRQEKDYNTRVSRVVSVEIYEPANLESSNKHRQESHQHVYTLSVEDGSYYADGLLVKNCQDLNSMQQALAYKSGHRIVGVGDPNQAIFGFAGADSESMSHMYDHLAATPVGCQILPLTVTRRCGKAIVKEANKLVPELEAHESNPEGEVLYKAYGNKHPLYYGNDVAEGDFLICRCNAPLISQCFKFLRDGRKATIMGRDIGEGLISTLRKMKAETVPDLIAALSDWKSREEANENAKRMPSEIKLINIHDRYDCLVAFAEGAQTIEDIVNKIQIIFTDDPHKPGIRLASIHKSKGLEANRIVLLMPKYAPCPHPMAKSAWQREQELHLLYVAQTRGIFRLTYATEDPKPS